MWVLIVWIGSVQLYAPMNLTHDQCMEALNRIKGDVESSCVSVRQMATRERSRRQKKSRRLFEAPEFFERD